MTRASMAYMKRLLVGGVAAALLTEGCSGDPALYLGGPAGPTTGLQLSTSRFILRAGEPATLGAQARDAVGNPTADGVSFASCDGAIVTVAATGSTEQWSQIASVTGVGLGESCVVVTAGAVTDTVRVAVGPSSIVIAGPDTVLSGVAGIDYQVQFYDHDGNALTAGPDFPIAPVVSLNPLRLPITEVGALAYTAAGQQPGNVRLQTSTTADFGGIVGVKVVTVRPGVFAGSMSANTATQGGAITVTAAIPWDGDEYVLFGSIPASNWTGVQADAVTNPSGGTLTFLVPWNVAPGTYDVTVVNQGPGQVAQVAAGFTVTAGTMVNNQQTPRSANNTSGTELRSRISLARPLAWPVVWDPTVTLTNYSYYTLNNIPAAGQGNAGEVVVRATLDWIDSCGSVCESSADEDFDIEIINGGFTAFLDLDAAALGKPEVSHFNANDGLFYFFRYRTYTGAGAAHAVIEWLGNGGLCADEAGCTIGGVP